MKTYFTFDSTETFPFQNTYLIIEGVSQEDCTAEFRCRYPDIIEGILNCSSAYSEEEWEKVKSSFDGRKHCEYHLTDAFNRRYDDLFIFIPSMRQILMISEGDGSNLLDEDQEEGYVDYINYEQYCLDVDMPLDDGGELMMKEYVRDHYKQLSDSIPDVLEFAYGNKDMAYTVLS
ncbi:MAG: hypothetical protein K2K56_04420 [Lachnospiraceae bacterium]|nr:hypothetical protein [Lachnospiraceae bacterium]